MQIVFGFWTFTLFCILICAGSFILYHFVGFLYRSGGRLEIEKNKAVNEALLKSLEERMDKKIFQLKAEMNGVASAVSAVSVILKAALDQSTGSGQKDSKSYMDILEEKYGPKKGGGNDDEGGNLPN